MPNLGQSFTVFDLCKIYGRGGRIVRVKFSSSTQDLTSYILLPGSRYVGWAMAVLTVKKKRKKDRGKT